MSAPAPAAPAFVILYFLAGGWYWPTSRLDERIRCVSNATLARALRDPRNSSSLLERLERERDRRIRAGDTINLLPRSPHAETAS